MIVIGSRGSQLALWQAKWVAYRLEQIGVATRIEVIQTTGDRITGVPLSKVGTKGLFTKEIEEALLARTIDIAVHSLKDMPTALPEGLTLAAIPAREDPRDAMVGRALKDLPRAATVGTSSLRRAAQLRAARPDLRVEPVRGNLDTRLKKLDSGPFKAIVLAAAGLRRLGWEKRIAETLPIETMCPAAGQGALAIETRAESGPVFDAVRGLEHEPTRRAITAERALLAGLGGGCQVPIGAHAWIEDELLCLRAVVAAPDGSKLIGRRAEGPPSQAEALGSDLARELLDGGAASILEAAAESS